jgi:hypothetical protein
MSTGLAVTQNAVELELAKLRAENAALRAAHNGGAPQGLTFKVMVFNDTPGKERKGGGWGIYRLARWPFTMYPSQWLVLFQNLGDFVAFCLRACDDKNTKLPEGDTPESFKAKIRACFSAEAAPSA